MVARLADVAKEADVSISTVSRVIRNTDYIAAPTRRKVLDAIQKLDYRPNSVARHLKYMRTYTIGFVINDISNPFFGHAVKGAEQYLLNSGELEFELLLINTNGEADREIKAIELMVNKRVEGIILSSTSERECINLIQKIVDTHQIPVVSIDNQLGGFEIGIVSAENYRGAYELTSHLLSHGHQRIGFISGPLSESHARERLDGFKSALAQNSLGFDENLLANGNWTVEGGYRAVCEWLLQEVPPSAIFCSNNFMCMGALSALSDHNIRVPADMAIVSFDDIEFGDLLRPCLTTLDYSWQGIGREAVKLVLEGIKANKQQMNPQSVHLPIQLLIRESCGCAYQMMQSGRQEVSMLYRSR